MKRCVAAVVLAVCAVDGASAQSALVKCDGFPRRVDTAETVARGVLALGTLGLSGMGERANPQARLKGAEAIKACTAALDDPLLTGNAVRRAEVLLARSAQSLGQGLPADAERDARAALAEELPEALRPQAARTLYPSLKLLIALARLAQDDQPGAEAAALEALALRPDSSVIGEGAFAILSLSPGISGPEAEQLAHIARNKLYGLPRRARHRLQAGDFSGAATDFHMLKLGTREPSAVIIAQDALAQALAGNNELARTVFTEAQEAADKLAIVAQNGGAGAAEATQIVNRADEMLQLTKARLAISDGRIDEARSLLASRSRWMVQAHYVAPVLEAAGAGKDWVSPVEPAKLRADTQKADREKLTGKEVGERMTLLLPRFEDADAAHDIGKAMAKLKGSSVKVAPTRDSSALNVILSGRMAQIDTQDEALFYAAALQAKARGMPRYVVVGSGLRYITPQADGPSSMGGSIEIVFPEGPGAAIYNSQKGRELNTDEVIATYAPLFPAGADGRR